MKSKSNPNPIRRVIINADDFGLSSAVNAGVEKAFREGVLTSTSLLANAPAFDEAVEIARENAGLGVGIHLNLVRGKPLSPTEEIPLLVKAGGGLGGFRLGRLTEAFLAQAETEYRRQFEKVLAARLKPTHIDFEKHHAWQGPLYLLACRLAREYGVPAVRNLREPVAWGVRNLGWPGLGKMVMAGMLRAGFDLGGGNHRVLAEPDRLLGQSHIGGMDENVWLKLIAHLPLGLSEIMTHPGVADVAPSGEMGSSWMGDSRQIELSALLSPAVREALDREEIERVSFAALKT